jgi:hypothetical protein
LKEKKRRKEARGEVKGSEAEDPQHLSFLPPSFLALVYL